QLPSDWIENGSESIGYRDGVSDDSNSLGVRLCQLALVAGSTVLIVLTFPLSVWLCVRVVQQYERAVIYRFGRVRGARGPGLYFVHALIDSVHVMDLRTVTFNIPPQEILTRDSVTISVDAVVYYRIFDPVKSSVVVCDVHRATRLMAQTTLRNTLGTKSLHEILSEKSAIALAMQDSLDAATDPWGVERVEVRDARLPVLMQRAMAVEAEAQREANASVIAAEGELTAALTLREAAAVIGRTPMGARLRYLQTLGAIAVEKQSTVLFLMPLQLMLDKKACQAVEGHADGG
uniref:PHB domain-containing protein n=1 Tax=Macrostomum lignano TaxID=282301 RepID=A0A1I8J267_9PLAT